jgi:uncharacterized membrane-anchored protein
MNEYAELLVDGVTLKVWLDMKEEKPFFLELQRENKHVRLQFQKQDPIEGVLKEAVSWFKNCYPSESGAV